jgi:Tol biopolymer transport system component/predicted Ser/Thr protein kinase
MSAAGRSFGPYQVLGPLGSGGMGEVYRARDQRLDRIVALKTSRTQFNDRMMKEARAAAALNHPHIATLHDVGPDYLVMEFVEGETLRGPLPVPKALVFTRQILDALAAAHRKGITHCDLKPANVMVSKTGVKLLDFGLAQIKLSIKDSDTAQTMDMTQSGTISGTLQYMAPEQFQSQPVDARTDIFAFGMVMYEMLTGQFAFRGSSPATLMHAILTQEPPPLELPDSVAPPKLEWIIRRCLAKDPDDRWQSATDIIHALDLIELEDGVPAPVHAAASAPVAASTVSRPGVGRGWGMAAVVLGGVLVFAALKFSKPSAPAAAPWTFRPITYSGRALRPALSPDGKQVAYLWTGDRNTPGGLYVQLANGGNPLRLPVNSVNGRPAWSPDASEVAFANEAGLFVMPALGGTPRKLTSFAPNSDTDGIAWAPSRTFFIIGGPGAGLSAMPADGGEPKEITKLSLGNDRMPAIAPDSSAVAFVRRTARYNSELMLMLLKADGASAGDAKPLTSGVWDIGPLTWSADGKEVFFEGSAGSNNPSLWRVARDGGTPIRLTMPSPIAGEPTIAHQTGRMVYVSGQYETKIFKLPLAPKTGEPQPLVEAIGDHRDMSVSPDGKHIAFTSNRTGSKEIWTADSDGRNQTQLTYFQGPAVGSPRWSPDGKSITFDGAASGSSDIYVVATDGGKPQRLTTDGGNEVRPSWSHDSKWIYYGWERAGREAEIWKIPPTGGEPKQVGKGSQAMETPDGAWLYVLGDSGLVRMHPDGRGEEKVPADVIGQNFWNIGARSIYVLEPKNLDIVRAPFGSTRFETVFHFNETNRPGGGGAAIAVPNDESFAIYRSATRSVNTLMLIDGFR